MVSMTVFPALHKTDVHPKAEATPKTPRAAAEDKHISTTRSLQQYKINVPHRYDPQEQLLTL